MQREMSSRFARWATLSVLCISLLIISLDSTVLNVALPTIVRRLHATSTQLQWIVDAYAMVFAGLLLVWGSVGDHLGRKWVLLAGLIVFAGGSLASAFSVNANILTASRALMGVGAAGIMPSTLSILTNVFTDAQDRARAIGIWSGTTGLGIAIGPLVGGWLLAHFWWGSVFLINVPIAAIGVITAAVVVPNSRDPQAKKPDPIGALLSIAGLGALLWGIIEAPTRSWGDPLVLLSISCGVVVLIVFVLWERKSTHPLLQLDFFENPRFSSAITSMALVIFALMGTLFLLTQYLQFSLGYDAFATGIRIMPIAIVMLVIAPLSSAVVRFVGTKVTVAAGMGCIVVGMIMLTRTTVAGSYLEALPALMLIGFGTALAFAPSTESVMGSLPLEKTGIGAATNSTALQVGGALGVAVLGSLLNTRYQDRLSPVLAGESIPRSIEHLILGSLGGALGVAQAVGGTLGLALADVARRAFVSGMDLALLIGAFAVGAGALVVLVALPSRPRTGRAPTDRDVVHRPLDDAYAKPSARTDTIASSEHIASAEAGNEPP